MAPFLSGSERVPRQARRGVTCRRSTGGPAEHGHAGALLLCRGLLADAISRSQLQAGCQGRLHPCSLANRAYVMHVLRYLCDAHHDALHVVLLIQCLLGCLSVMDRVSPEAVPAQGHLLRYFWRGAHKVDKRPVCQQDCSCV